MPASCSVYSSWDSSLKPVAANSIPEDKTQVKIGKELYFGRSIKKNSAEICKRITQAALIVLASLLIAPSIILALTGSYARFVRMCIELKKGVAIQGKVDQTPLPTLIPQANPIEIPPTEPSQFWANDYAKKQYQLALNYQEGKGCEKNLEKAFECFRLSAEQEHVLAQYQLGDWYEKGIGCKKNIDKAIKYFEMAAKKGHYDALLKMIHYYRKEFFRENPKKAFKYLKQFAKKWEYQNTKIMLALAHHYENEVGCKYKPEKAFKYYVQAAIGRFGDEDPFARNTLAFRFAKGMDENPEQAFKFLKKSVEPQDAKILFQLGRCFEEGIGCKKNREKAFKYYELGSEKEHPNAQKYLAFCQNRVGRCYEKGRGCEKNQEKALAYYKLAATKSVDKFFSSYSEALNNLGRCYEKGIGCEKNPEKAFDYFDKAYKQGRYYKAAWNLARCLENGIGCKKNIKDAFRHYILYVENADDIPSQGIGKFFRWSTAEIPSAQCNLAHCYEKGIGGWGQSLELAYKYYKLAAEQDYPHAQYHLGRFYENGIGCNPDLNLAFKYYESAAEKEYLDAEYHLARCYENSIGCKQDLEKAMDIYNQLAEKGHSDAQNHLDRCSENKV